VVDEAACTGCALCVRDCPEGAVAGEKKKPHRIDPSKCSKCGKCLNACNVGAIHRV
jgi:NAD-dependent dihydropyrimidine dehydrogenase PreA subunit